MSERLTRAAYAELIAEDIAWLNKQRRTLERDHIRAVLEKAVECEYGPEPEGMHFGEYYNDYAACGKDLSRGGRSWNSNPERVTCRKCLAVLERCTKPSDNSHGDQK